MGLPVQEPTGVLLSRGICVLHVLLFDQHHFHNLFDCFHGKTISVVVHNHPAMLHLPKHLLDASHLGHLQNRLHFGLQLRRILFSALSPPTLLDPWWIKANQQNRFSEFIDSLLSRSIRCLSLFSLRIFHFLVLSGSFRSVPPNHVTVPSALRMSGSNDLASPRAGLADPDDAAGLRNSIELLF